MRHISTDSLVHGQGYDILIIFIIIIIIMFMKV
jgi:hypothetical protein